MTLEVKNVKYDVIGDQADITFSKSVGGHSWVVQASFPLRLVGQDSTVPDRTRIMEEARRILLEAAGCCGK